MEKTHLTLNSHKSQSTIIKNINIYEFLNAKAFIQWIDNFINRDVLEILLQWSSASKTVLGTYKNGLK